MLGELREGGHSCLWCCRETSDLPKPSVLPVTMEMAFFQILHGSLSEQNVNQNPIGKGLEETGSHAFGTCHPKRADKESEIMLGANRRVSGPSGLLSSSSCIPLCTFHMMTEFPLSSFVIAILSIPSRGLTLSRGLVNTGHERISACLVRGCESQALPLYPTLY